jgi:tRNA threonylcarbamoyladenosine biosynthesis protein TsaE
MEIVVPLKGIDRVVEYLNQTVGEDAIIFLMGDLASGKTTLTKAIAKSKNIDASVTSPTFGIQHRYGKNFYHYDLYRLSHHEFMEMGIFEEFDKSGWHIIEWGDEELKKFLLNAGYRVYTLYITLYQRKRKYVIKEG